MADTPRGQKILGCILAVLAPGLHEPRIPIDHLLSALSVCVSILSIARFPSWGEIPGRRFASSRRPPHRAEAYCRAGTHPAGARRGILGRPRIAGISVEQR